MKRFREYRFGDMLLSYDVDEQNQVAMRLIPAEMDSRVIEKKYRPEPLVQLHARCSVRCDGGATGQGGQRRAQNTCRQRTGEAGCGSLFHYREKILSLTVSPSLHGAPAQRAPSQGQEAGCGTAPLRSRAKKKPSSSGGGGAALSPAARGGGMSGRGVLGST